MKTQNNNNQSQIKLLIVVAVMQRFFNLYEMELEKRFLPFCDHEYANREDNAMNCVDVADEYAMKFAEWIIRQDITSRGIGFYVNYIGDLVTTKDLLELFKREYSEAVA